ncbi:MAG: LamG domain-containing protein, partial [Planctomycetes bacterium]|nr:LamG domain-containing protein [Planctomycetota bacterium]
EEVPDGQPYFRDAQDLLLELGFNQTVRPDGERRDIQVKEESLTVKGLGQSREARGYSGGVQGDALKLGPEMARPEYSSRDLMNDDAGTIAFWFRPLNWDNFSRVDFRRKKGKRRGLNLFKVYGPRPDKLQKYRPMRGGDPSLMSFSIHVTPNANQPVPPRYHPGRWTHVALTWNGKRKTIYIDGKKVGYAGLSAATHVWYRKGGKQRKLNNILPGSHPRRLQISGRGGDLRTLLDDFRIYRRPLAPSEIQNLLALYDPRRELAKLPPMDVSFSYNGVRGSVEASATPLMAEYQNVRSIRVGLYPGQDPDPLGVATAPTSDVGRTDVKLETDPFGFGKYELRISALNGDDAEMAQVDREFTREKPPWWGNQYGISDEVMPGWDPVRVDGSTVKISRREIAFGGTGLPKKIVSAGEPILQSPPRLSIVAGGEQQKWVTGAGPSIITDGEVKANVSGTARSQKLTIHTEATVEFDGFMWFRLRISPRGEQPVEVEKMTLRLPYRPQDAEMIHWWSGDRGFRHPKVVHIGAVPTEEGVVFRSNDEERVRHPEKLVGNFIPYVMLTGDRRGMSWFAENDQGWTKTNSVSAVEVERTDDAVVLRLNIIAEPVQLAGEREIQFGLQPIPLKNRPSYWRRTDDWAVIPDTFSGSNLKGDKGSTAFYLYPKVSWDEVMDIYRGSRMQSRYRNALERYRTRHDREPRPLEIRIPGLYWDMQWIGGFPPHTREWSPQWTSNFSVHTPEFIDFCAWAWHEWIKNTDRTVRGIYMDDCWGAPKSMPDSPATYELPDGRTQVGYELRGYRQRMKRLRQVAHDAGITPHFCGHSTHTFFTPYHSFFDIVLDGEDHYQSPPNQKDFIDYWSLPRIRFMNGEKWGIITSWLGWHGNNLDRDKYPAWTWRHQRAFSAMMALHDITWPLYIKDGAFRIRQEGTQFIPYWERGGPAETENPDVRVSAWRKDGKCLLLAVNTSDKRVEARMKLRFDRMGGTNGKPADVTVKDVDGNLLRYFGEDVTQVEKPKATMGLEDEEDVPEVMLEEQPEDLPVEKRRAQDPDGKYNWENGVLSCPIRPHDYRLFVMEE